MIPANQLSQGLHCKACDCQLGETAYDPELCNTCIEVVWESIKDIDPEDTMSSTEPYDEEEHF